MKIAYQKKFAVCRAEETKRMEQRTKQRLRLTHRRTFGRRNFRSVSVYIGMV